MPSTAQLLAAISRPTMWWLPVPKWKMAAPLAFFFSFRYSTKCRSHGHCASSRLHVASQKLSLVIATWPGASPPFEFKPASSRRHRQHGGAQQHRAIAAPLELELALVRTGGGRALSQAQDGRL